MSARDVRSTIVEVLRHEYAINARSAGRLANTIMNRIAKDPAALAEWTESLGVIRRIGWASKRNPKRIAEVPLRRDEMPVYERTDLANED